MIRKIIAIAVMSEVGPMIALARSSLAHHLSSAICETPCQFFRIRPRRTAPERVAWTSPPSDQEKSRLADGVRYGVFQNEDASRSCQPGFTKDISRFRPDISQNFDATPAAPML